MIRNTKLLFALMLVVMTASVAVIGTVRPKWGIDFTGGALMEVALTERGSLDGIRSALAEKLQMDLNAQTTSENTVLVRLGALTPQQHEDAVLALQEKGLISEELRFESIGPTIGAELRRKAWVAIGLAVAGMIAFLAYTFRQAAGLIASWKFGVAAVIALAHDLLFVTAVFVILGKLYGASIDSLFMTAMLAILGYSVNDTIIIFNRLKEDWLTSRRGNLITIMDKAARATIARSLNTSITTLLGLLALLFFGGETIRWFIVALTIGVAVGTYSSIFVAPPVLYVLSKR